MRTIARRRAARSPDVKKMTLDRTLNHALFRHFRIPRARSLPGARPRNVPAWHAGAASVVITPKESLWMAGYAARNKPSEGKAQDLFAKALALEGRGRQPPGDRHDGPDRHPAAVCATRSPRRRRRSISLPPAALLLNASHTHCGPVVRSGRLGAVRPGRRNKRSASKRMSRTCKGSW